MHFKTEQPTEIFIYLDLELGAALNYFSNFLFYVCLHIVFTWFIQRRPFTKCDVKLSYYYSVNLYYLFLFVEVQLHSLAIMMHLTNSIMTINTCFSQTQHV